MIWILPPPLCIRKELSFILYFYFSHLQECTKELKLENMVSLSIDRPNVNWKFVELIQKSMLSILLNSKLWEVVGKFGKYYLNPSEHSFPLSTNLHAYSAYISTFSTFKQVPSLPQYLFHLSIYTSCNTDMHPQTHTFSSNHTTPHTPKHCQLGLNLILFSESSQTLHQTRCSGRFSIQACEAWRHRPETLGQSKGNWHRYGCSSSMSQLLLSEWWEPAPRLRAD